MPDLFFAPFAASSCQITGMAAGARNCCKPQWACLSGGILLH